MTSAYPETITGNFVICSSGTPFTLNHLPLATTITWQTSSNLSLVSAQGSNPCTIKSTANGSAWIYAILSCGNTAIPSIPVWSGAFDNTVVIGQAPVCPNSLYTYTAQVPGGHKSNYTYSWTYPSGWYNNGQIQNMINLQTPQYNMQYGAVRVSITNQCGTSNYNGITVFPGSCHASLILSPNPASDIVNVTIIPAQTSNADSTSSVSVTQTVNTPQVTYKVLITDLMGTSYYNATKNTVSFIIPVQALPNGNYIITVDDGVNKGSAQLVVKH